MEFIVSSSDLLSQLNALKTVINSKNPLPILDDFLFTLDGNSLKIEATDLETRLETTMQLESANGSGIFAVNAKQLTDSLNLFSDEPLTFKVNLDNYAIEYFSASGKYKICGESGEEYPRVMSLNEDTKTSVSIPSEIIQHGLASSVFASGDDPTRVVLNGVYVELNQEHLRFVATDGNQLSRYTRTDVKTDNATSFILPKKTATLLKALAAKDGNNIVVEFDDTLKQVIVKLTSYTMSCRVIEGKFPNYDAVIPRNNANDVSLTKEDFYRKIRRVAFFSETNVNLIVLNIDGSMMDIRAKDLNANTSAQEQMACRHEGEAIQIGFKSKLLLSILDNISSEDVHFSFGDGQTKACLISPVDKLDPNEDVLMLLMPMMI